MKKLFVLILALALIFSLSACGGNTGSGNSASGGNNTSTPTAGNNAVADTNGKLNPPDWLVGTWETADGTETIEVTAHNVTVSKGNLDFSYQISQNLIKVTETNDGGVYRLSYQAGGVDTSYAFEKQSDGTMNRTLTTGGMDIPKIFTKK